MLMSIKYHLHYGWALCAVGFMLGAFIGLFVAVGLGLELGSVWVYILFFFCGYTGCLAAPFIFFHLVHARCPQCGGTARQQPGVFKAEEIFYECSSCGYKKQIGWSYSSSNSPF